MTTEPNPFKSERPPQGETANHELTLDSRAVMFPQPDDAMWPIKLHDPRIYEAASETLPVIVARLSKPVESAEPADVKAIFDSGTVPERQTPWVWQPEEDGYSVYSAPYEGQPDENGGTPIFYGVRYGFDKDGRMILREYIEGQHSHDRGRPNFQEHLSYDEEGYLTKHVVWQQYARTVVDDFEYGPGEDGKKVPTAMSRVVRLSSDDSEPMVVDLANYQQWLEENPNGFARVTKEALNPAELDVANFSVKENRRGIRFTDPEQLELALVMYGDGNYPTPGTETALEHNDKSYADTYGPLGGVLFSMMSRSHDMSEFVRSAIMEGKRGVLEQWEWVQKSKDPNASESTHFGFDYNGAGHFHKTSGDVKMTKSGLELTMYAAYVGSEVEERLASALAKKRGLLSASIEIPVNQAAKEGYFFVDILAVCQKLGLPVSEGDVESYLQDWFATYEEQAKDSYDATYGKRPSIWHDPQNGVTVTLDVERKDHDADADLQMSFSHDGTSIWGPLPRNTGSRRKKEESNKPVILLTVKPEGDPFDPEIAQGSDDVLRSYMMRLQK